MQDQSVLSLLEQILKTSQTGRNYNNTPYDRERYEFIIQIVNQLYQLLTEVPLTKMELLEKEMGYITPKVGVNALITNAEGKVLLEKRVDDHCWGLPGGWAEVGISAEENVAKEVKEETGLLVSVQEILGCFSRLPGPDSIHTTYHLLYRCEVTGGKLKSSHESTEIAWKIPETVEHWHKDHYHWLRQLRLNGPFSPNLNLYGTTD